MTQLLHRHCHHQLGSRVTPSGFVEEMLPAKHYFFPGKVERPEGSEEIN